MCELFGVSTATEITANALLKTFYSHSEKHHNGWGLALLGAGGASVEKEPVKASDSAYLRERLRWPLRAGDLIAHIRLASVGEVEYVNCHPFVRHDADGRCWTLAHNGTLFSAPAVDPYFYSQEGRTDSERILLYLIDLLAEARLGKGAPLDDEDRFGVVERLARELSPGNKLNFLLHDGRTLYAHRNFGDYLHMRQEGGTTLVATQPLDRKPWRPVPLTTLHAFRDGALVQVGADHGGVYVENPSDTEYLYLDAAVL